MFQASSEGGNLGVEVRQDTQGKRIRFYFSLTGRELDIGRLGPPLFTFSKQDYFEFCSGTLNHRPPAVHLFG